MPDRLSFPLVALSLAGVALYAFAVVRYLALYREAPLTAAARLHGRLRPARGGDGRGRRSARSWQASWWEWHVLMLLAFGVIAGMAHREGIRGALRPALPRPRRTSGDRALRRPPGIHRRSRSDTSPARSRRCSTRCSRRRSRRSSGTAATIDRLIGDAVFATFEGDDHAERAARAALALQEETGALAAEHPDWPRFRAGVNTGEAAVGVLRQRAAAAPTARSATRSTSPPGSKGLAPAGGVAISAETASRAPGRRDGAVRRVQVKGRDEPVEVLLLLKLPGS